MNELINDSKRIIFNKIFEGIKKGKTVESIVNDIEFINAFFVFSICSAIMSDLNKSLENLKRVCLNDT